MTIILLSIFFPILCGVYLLVRREFEKRKSLLTVVSVFFLMSAWFLAAALRGAQGKAYTLFYLMENLPIVFQIDEVGVLFARMAAVVFLCAGLFSFEYMKHERKEKRFYGYYLLALGVLYALCFAGNLVTFYLFFEVLTLSSMPLVLHSGSHEAVMAGLKYLFYSLCGAYMALFGLYLVSKYGDTLTFTTGGVLGAQTLGHTELLLVTAFLMLIGFGVKAGMFPMHAWLTAAHPAAPAPASAVLSGVVVKAGVLGIIRVVFYIFGTEFLRGTWVQTVWLVLTLVTVFMGSMLAYREDGLKKRLAYSTISQVSYILFGLAMMEGTSVVGAMLQLLSHGFVKAGLFLCAGAIIVQTGRTKVSELRGIGREMPFTMWCFVILSLGLIGIPPTGGFLSKWYLAEGALGSGVAGFSLAGPIVLLVSALLTAGYLLPVAIRGFFPGKEHSEGGSVYSEGGSDSSEGSEGHSENATEIFQKLEEPVLMKVPILVFAVLSVALGVLPGGIISRLADWAAKIMIH